MERSEGRERERERMMLLVFLLRSHDSLRSVLTALAVAGGRLHRHTSALDKKKKRSKLIRELLHRHSSSLLVSSESGENGETKGGEAAICW